MQSEALCVIDLDFLKRSMNPGYSGVDNLLFYQDNTSLIFGDAKDTIEGMVAALKGSAH